MRKYIWLILLLFTLSGCSAKGLEARAHYLNERKMNACLCGDLHVGGGWGATVNGTIKGLIATGGTKIPECQRALPCN